MNLAHTDDTELRVFAEFEPKLSEASARPTCSSGQHPARPAAAGSRAVRPAAGGPRLHEPVDRDGPRVAAAAIREVDCVLLNDSEIRMLTEEPNLARAARKVMELGPTIVVAKRGEYGAVMFTPERSFALPGYLLEEVRDPTGARRQLRGGLPGLPRHAGDGPRRGGAAQGGRLRDGSRLFQRPGVRRRASGEPLRGGGR